jgi:hypothetical protein
MGPARIETLPGLSRAARDDILGNTVRTLLNDLPRRTGSERRVKMEA